MKAKHYLFAVFSLLQGSLFAQQTAQSIQKNQEIKLGYLADAFPFSYVNEGESVPTGFSHDFELLVVEKLKKSLNVPNLKVSYTLTDSSNRFSLLDSGDLQLYCARNNNSTKYAGKALPSINYFYIESRFVVRKDSGIEAYGDIKGKVIGLTKGATVGKILAKLKNKLKFKEFHETANHNETVQLLINKEIDAAATDGLVGLGTAMLMDSEHYGDYAVVGNPLQEKYYTCWMPKNDPEWKKVVDSAVAEVIKSQDFQKVYDKWFTKPIPPKNVNFNYPISDRMFKHIILEQSDATQIGD